MKLPWSRKKEPESSKTIQASLNSDRPDLNVSLWLQEVSERHPKLPIEVENAHLTDRFLVELNSGGVDGLLSWQSSDVAKMPQALAALGLSNFASPLDHVLQNPGANHEAFENLVVESSGEIEQATHNYIRAHVDIFTELDPN